MKEWDDASEQVSKITPDKEKAKALLAVIELRKKNIKLMNKEEFATLIAESYYEIIKELITALMSIDGWKTVSHEMLTGYLARFYKDFSQAELRAIDQLRKTRNDIAYRGATVKKEYLDRNEKDFSHIINKLSRIVKRKIRIPAK